jgi:hypothetical protein
MDARRTAATGSSSENLRETPVISWRVHPLRERPGGIALVACGYGAAFLLWRLLFPNPFALCVPLIAMTAALSDYLFPTGYRLTRGGAHVDGAVSRLYIAWGDVRRATYGREGAFLSPFSRPSRLDGFRGVRLRFAAGNDADVLRAIRSLRGGDDA